MTKEVPGIRPAVISTETGTRLGEYRRFRHVVRNAYAHSFDPAKLGKLVHSVPELFARTKAEPLALAAVLEHERVILRLRFFPPCSMCFTCRMCLLCFQHVRASTCAIVQFLKNLVEVPSDLVIAFALPIAGKGSIELFCRLLGSWNKGL